MRCVSITTVPVLLGEVGRRGAVREPGVVDEHVDAAEAGERPAIAARTCSADDTSTASWAVPSRSISFEARMSNEATR